MDAERWKKIDALVAAALELPAAEREKFVATNCERDETLKREVLELLSAHDESNDFLQKSAMNLMAKAIAGDDRTVFDRSGRQFVFPRPGLVERRQKDNRLF